MGPRWRIRPAVAALPAAFFAALLLRPLFVGVGADEFSLLAMARSIRNGALPYAVHWDVRPPLAYLWGLPSAYAEDASAAVGLLRMLALLAQSVAAWIFFCLFQRTLGATAAAVGALSLLAAANMTGLHAMALPNHFVMALSVAAFACLIAGLRGRVRVAAFSVGGGGESGQGNGLGLGQADSAERRSKASQVGGRRLAYWISALLAGTLPWLMAHAGLTALCLAALAVFGPSQYPWRRRWQWVALAAAPSAAVVAVYFFWGPFDVFVRTLFMAPLGVLDMRSASGYRLFAWADAWQLASASPWMVAQLLLLAAGAAWLPGAIRRAPRGSPLRLCAFLILPPTVGFAAMAYVKPPAPPEYWIDMAPVIGLLAAASLAKILAWRGWWAPWLARHARLGVLRPCLAAYLCAVLLSPVDPWREAPKPPLPVEYCRDVAADEIDRLAAGRTVLDTLGLCGFSLLDSDVNLHPPFTFGRMWLRQLSQPWVGQALAGDGSSAAAAERLRKALAPESSVGLILADNQLLLEVRNQDWERWFFEEWRLAWHRRLEGRDPDERLGSLAVFVRDRPHPDSPNEGGLRP